MAKQKSSTNAATRVKNGKMPHNSYVLEKLIEPQEGQDDDENRSTTCKRLLRLNEWTFTLLLFLVSSAVILGKLLFSRGYFGFLDVAGGSSSNRSSQIYHKDVAENNRLIEDFNAYSWLIKAVLSGLATTAITWYIIYEDSNVPGVSPPSPFSPAKNKSLLAESSSIQMNYIIGIVNGVLLFLYMCL